MTNVIEKVVAVKRVLLKLSTCHQEMMVALEVKRRR